MLWQIYIKMYIAYKWYQYIYDINFIIQEAMPYIAM